MANASPTIGKETPKISPLSPSCRAANKESIPLINVFGFFSRLDTLKSGNSNRLLKSGNLKLSEVRVDVPSSNPSRSSMIISRGSVVVDRGN